MVVNQRIFFKTPPLSTLSSIFYHCHWTIIYHYYWTMMCIETFTRTHTRSIRPEVFLTNSVLKICSKFTGEHTWRSAVSIKLLCIFIEIALRHGCSPVNLLHIFRTPFSKNTPGHLLWSTFHYGKTEINK